MNGSTSCLIAVSVGREFRGTVLWVVGWIKLLCERDLYFMFLVSIFNFYIFLTGVFWLDYISSDNWIPKGELDYFASFEFFDYKFSSL